MQTKVSQDFDAVYAEFLTRIQPKYLDEYRNCIYQYIEPKNTTVIEGTKVFGTFHDSRIQLPSGKKKLYVDPVSNQIKKA